VLTLDGATGGAGTISSNYPTNLNGNLIANEFIAN